MAKPDEARSVLEALGLPPQQRTSIAAYTLLALADLAERRPWREAKRRSIRIHDVLAFVRDQYGKTYAENTRETIRRQVLHQFEQARVVDRNPDNPALSTNSPRTHYAVSVDALPVLRTHSSKRFRQEAAKFRRNYGALLEVYRASQKRTLVPVKLPSGSEALLSPGKHNELQAAIVRDFASRFAPGASLLYMGDTANKTLHLEEGVLKKLGIPVTRHDKLPDVLLWEQRSHALFLVEAVTSHGPVSPKRMKELEALLHDCSLHRVYGSAFPDFSEFQRHAQNIAWETEVWLADMPDHMIITTARSFWELSHVGQLGPRSA